MRNIALAALTVPLLLAACATTPRQQCEAPYRADLRTVLEETSSTSRALALGYRLVPATTSIGVHYCMAPTGRAVLCINNEDDEPLYDKRPINRFAEQAKLDALNAERKRLESAIAQCAAQYPE